MRLRPRLPRTVRLRPPAVAVSERDVIRFHRSRPRLRTRRSTFSATRAVRETRTVTFAALRHGFRRAQRTATLTETIRVAVGTGGVGGAGVGVGCGVAAGGGGWTITGQPSGVGAGCVGQRSSSAALASPSTSSPRGVGSHASPTVSASTSAWSAFGALRQLSSRSRTPSPSASGQPFAGPTTSGHLSPDSWKPSWSVSHDTQGAAGAAVAEVGGPRMQRARRVQAPVGARPGVEAGDVVDAVEQGQLELLGDRRSAGPGSRAAPRRRRPAASPPTCPRAARRSTLPRTVEKTDIPGANRSTDASPTLPQQTGLSTRSVMPTQIRFSASLLHGIDRRLVVVVALVAGGDDVQRPGVVREDGR